MNLQQKIQHLYWRAGFGISLTELESSKNLDFQQVIEKLFKDSTKVNPLKILDETAPTFKEILQASKEERKEMRKDSRKLIKELNIKWLDQMVNTSAQLREKMTFFWHGHFACQAKNIYHAQIQINTIRQHALGNFKDLVMAIAKDPAMLAFLNNQQNRKAHPNENFARELMELFTLGRGNYTENDIKESARAFTGWGFDGENYIFRERQHDFGQKTFMGKTGNFDGEDIIKMILEKPQTAQFITTKIYKFIVNEVPDNQLVEKLAQKFYQSNYDISQLLKEIFKADWFYDAKNVGTKIKSPIELIVGLQRQFNLKFVQEDSPLFIQKVLGQILLFPPNVAGWAGGRNWIDSSSLMFRLKLGETLFKISEIDISAKEEDDVQKAGIINEKLRKFQADFDWNSMLKYVGNTDNFEAIYQKISDYLLQNKSDSLKNLMQKFKISSNREDLIKNLAIDLAGVPEYQVC